MAGARASHSSIADLTIGDHSHVIEADSAKSLQFKPPKVWCRTALTCGFLQFKKTIKKYTRRF